MPSTNTQSLYLRASQWRQTCERLGCDKQACLSCRSLVPLCTHKILGRHSATQFSTVTGSLAPHDLTLDRSRRDSPAPQHGGGPNRLRRADQRGRGAAAAAPASAPCPPMRLATAAEMRPCARRSPPHPTAPSEFQRSVVLYRPIGIPNITGNSTCKAYSLESTSYKYVHCYHANQGIIWKAAICHGLQPGHLASTCSPAAPSELLIDVRVAPTWQT